MASTLQFTPRNRLVERKDTTVEAHLALLDEDQDNAERWNAVSAQQLNSKIDRIVEGQVWIIRAVVGSGLTGITLFILSHWK